MTTRGEATRERLLSVAEETILQKGFAGTSIDEIIRRAAITKGGFFYHFRGKDDLAVRLMERYRENDHAFFMGLADRARDLTEDPLQQMLIFLKLLAEAMADLPTVHPGCLVATFVYESQQVNSEVNAVNEQCILDWRTTFTDQLALINQSYRKRIDVADQELGDMLTTVIEGGIVVSKALQQQEILVQQILQYRNYVKLLYEPRAAA